MSADDAVEYVAAMTDNELRDLLDGEKRHAVGRCVTARILTAAACEMERRRLAVAR